MRLPMVVVLPTPFTPTTIITYGFFSLITNSVASPVLVSEADLKFLPAKFY
jgi:hypothetical protein